MTAKEQNEQARKRVAAARPKLSAAQITTARKASIRRLRITEGITTALLVIGLVYVQSCFTAAAGPGAPNEALFNMYMVYWGIYLVYIAFMIRTAVVRMNHDYTQVSDDKTDSLFRGLRLTWFAPLIALLILIPSFMSGVFLDSEMTTGAMIGFSFFALVIATIGAPLVAAFVIAPIELLLRGIIAIVRRDTSRMHYAVVGLSIAGLTAFIAFGTAAVSPALPYPAGSVQVVLALLGIPGDYDVKSEVFLWVTRAIVLFYVLLIAYATMAKPKQKQNTAS